jgi:hypothetical protein
MAQKAALAHMPAGRGYTRRCVTGDEGEWGFAMFGASSAVEDMHDGLWNKGKIELKKKKRRVLPMNGASQG